MPTSLSGPFHTRTRARMRVGERENSAAVSKWRVGPLWVSRKRQHRLLSKPRERGLSPAASAGNQAMTKQFFPSAPLRITNREVFTPRSLAQPWLSGDSSADLNRLNIYSTPYKFLASHLLYVRAYRDAAQLPTCALHDNTEGMQTMTGISKNKMKAVKTTSAISALLVAGR